jgi:hypothetical protein
VQLYNLGGVAAWTGAPEPLLGGAPVFRPGYGWERMDDVTETTDWDTDPLRLLHVCFLRRSSSDAGDVSAGRLNLNEQGTYKRGLVGRLKRRVRAPRIDPRVEELHRQGSNWKLDKYRRGPRVEVDARPFLGQAVAR